MKTSLRKLLQLKRDELALGASVNEVPARNMPKYGFFAMRRAKGKRGGSMVGAPADIRQVPSAQHAVQRVQHKSSFQHIMEHRMIEDENGKCSNPKCSICGCWFLDKLPPGFTLNSSSPSELTPTGDGSSSSSNASPVSNSSTLTDLTAADSTPLSSTPGVQASLPAGFTCGLTAATKPLDTMAPLASGPFTTKGPSSPCPSISPGSASIPAGQMNSHQALLSAQGSSSSSAGSSSVFSSPRSSPFPVEEGQGEPQPGPSVLLLPPLPLLEAATVVAADKVAAPAHAAALGVEAAPMEAAQPAFDAIKTSEKAQEPRPTEGREADLTEVAVTQDGSSSTCSDTIIDMAALRVVVDDGGATVAKTAAGGCAVAPVTMPDEVRCAVAPVTMPDEAPPTAAASGMTSTLQPSPWKQLKSAVRSAFTHSSSRSSEKEVAPWAGGFQRCSAV